MIETLEIFGCDGMIMIEFSVAFMKHGLIERYIMKNGKTILMMKFTIIDS